MNPKGVVIQQSSYSVEESINRIEKFILEHKATVYARIDQQKEAKNVELHLLPLEFILFGNPSAGAPVMAESPLAALDLPLKIIAWEDDQKKVWLAWNTAAYIEERYSLSQNPNSPFNLEKLINDAMK